MNKLGAAPAVAIYGGSAGDTLCRGRQIGEISLQNSFPPPPFSMTTQCILIPPRYLTLVTVVALNAGTEVSYPRFVSNCSCPRQYVLRTTCGGEPGVSGACSTGFGLDGGTLESGF